MKKSLISVALTLAFASAAHAQLPAGTALSLYGVIDASYGVSLFSDVSGPNAKADFHSGGDNGSSEGNSTTRVGLKGNVDIGGGMKAKFAFETGGIESSGTVNGGGAFFNRQAWVGLAGGFGEVRLGRQDSVSFQTMIDFDFNGASNGVSAGAYSGVGVFNQGRQSRSLQYLTPTMGGLSAQFGFVPKGDNVTRGEPDAKSVFSAGAKYAAGPLTIGASLQTKADSNSKQFFSVAGSYDFGMAKVMLGYADGGKITQGGTGAGPTVGITVPVAGFNVGGILSNNSDKSAEVTSYEIFINKEVYKNTYLYAEFGDWKSDKIVTGNGTKKASGYAAGLIFTF